MMLRTLPRFRWASAYLACLACVLAPARTSAQSEAALQYQTRGDRSEGLRTIAVGGYDIELLSARVEPPGTPGGRTVQSGWAESVHLRFFMPGDDKVYITVRQLRSRTTYYWLNNVTSVFRPRMVNEYRWSSEPVLRRLPDLRIDELGVVVRVGQEQPSKRERVLPALLSEASASDPPEAYRFVLKTNGRANVSAAIYAEDRPLYRRPANWEPANGPFTVRWDSRSSPEGWYRLVLTGYFENNTPLDKEILFYHHPGSSR